LKLSVSYRQIEYQEQAQALANQLDVPLLDSAADLNLEISETGLALQLLGKNAPGPIAVNFNSGRMAHRRRGGQNELLGRAVGVGKKTNLSVVDATAGLGGDSFVLADLGCDVVCLERSAVIFQLLQDGWLRGCRDSEIWVRESCARINPIQADAIPWLNEECAQQVDVVYLDPMFPDRSKAARARKEMWLFQQFLEDDMDSKELLSAALARAKYRVVVKRPLRAAPLDGPVPGFDIRGKAVRFDVYSLQKLQD
jgi:16S rRNA (guanine1516-N2)-methyltransferase